LQTENDIERWSDEILLLICENREDEYNDVTEGMTDTEREIFEEAIRILKVAVTKK
jgi:hypothetical protein